MSDNPDTITALARLEEAERENQKLRSERLLAEHARDEAHREVGRVRDMLAIAERDRDIYRTNSFDWEADCGDWRQRAEAAEARVKECCALLDHEKEVRAHQAEALRKAMDSALAAHAKTRDTEARLRAVIEAGDDAFAALERRVHNASADWSAFAEAKRRYLSARSADLPPHPDTVALDKVLHDPSYEGGVQYWIRKHDEVEATLAGLMMELGKRSPDIRKLINEEMHRREKARAQAGKEGA